MYNIKPKTSPLTQATSSGQAHHLDWIYVITLRILTTFWILYEKRPLPAHTRRLGFKLGLSAPHSGRISSHWIYDTFFIEHKFGFTGWRADGPAHTHTHCAREVARRTYIQGIKKSSSFDVEIPKEPALSSAVTQVYLRITLKVRMFCLLYSRLQNNNIFLSIIWWYFTRRDYWIGPIPETNFSWKIKLAVYVIFLWIELKTYSSIFRLNWIIRKGMIFIYPIPSCLGLTSILL